MFAPNIITTGHNADGHAIFIDGPQYKTVSPHVGLIYSTDGNALDLNGNADITAFATREHAGLIPKEGAVVLVAEWPPSTDSRAKIHRTLSVDVGVVTRGSIECVLDSGESRVIKQGEVLIQRGTKHAWINPSATESAKMVCFVMPSKPVDGVRD